jgi:DNA polymerase-3 subunit gamma/tau
LNPDQPAAYRVLARTYRPTRLSELVGQDALVRTLTNALKSGRVAHAFMLSGIRGVGKTTTARIIARALNCTGPDGHGGPTPEPCGICSSCIAIGEDRSLDVLEMDAATNTGIDNIRELIGTVAYAPTGSRFKVYIIDEVHMLSQAAFNGLLKTLEEPPPHVKFVFATTELRKVPITVLSRCQRFELRRVDPDVIVTHLKDVCAREGVEAEPDALALIGRLAGGSMRDALSLLDQAIALGQGRVAAGPVRDMLGLADQGRLAALFGAVMRGDAGATLDHYGELHGLGADPVAVLQDLLELTHRTSRLKAGAGAADPTIDPSLPVLLDQVTIGSLTRAWQILLRGIEEADRAPDARAAAEMVLLRIATAAELPPPSELMRLVRDGQSAPGPVARLATRSSPALASATAPVALPAPETDRASSSEPSNFPELISRLRHGGEPLLAAWLHEAVHLVRFEPGRLEFRPEPNLPTDLASKVSTALLKLTGRRWMVALVSTGGEPTLSAQADAARSRRLAELGQDPEVRAVLELFPGAQVVDVRQTSGST